MTVNPDALALAQAGELESLDRIVEEAWPSPREQDRYGDNYRAQAEFWEQLGDALEPPGAAEAYDRALSRFAAIASWATSGGEGIAGMIEVGRVTAKLKAAGGDPSR